MSISCRLLFARKNKSTKRCRREEGETGDLEGGSVEPKKYASIGCIVWRKWAWQMQSKHGRIDEQQQLRCALAKLIQTGRKMGEGLTRKGRMKGRSGQLGKQ